MKSGIKRKTSVTLSPTVVRQIDDLAGKSGNRSAVIERAVVAYWTAQKRSKRDARDREILEAHADSLRKEAADVLEFQVDL
jgi:Arc/MetJ-type ribon-helix-helix transcriptional regulator